MIRALLVAGWIVGALVSVVSTVAAQTTKVSPLLSRDLVGILGKEGAMFLVEYPPGAGDPVHRHFANVFVYVLEGSIVMQVEGGPPVTLHPGQTFYEGPNDVHLVGHNASTTEPAKFLAFFVKQKGAPIMVPVQKDRHQ